jgi:hypothetical protein
LKRKYYQVRNNLGKSGSAAKNAKEWPFFSILHGFLKDANVSRSTKSSFGFEEDSDEESEPIDDTELENRNGRKKYSKKRTIFKIHLNFQLTIISN